ncbi:MAG: pilus assembly protein PilM, partial [Candidatus Omnitrophota bacterium]|nr:pilus assembly protein PilM [Candidatus Omnitrophota bacterium]
MGFAGNKLITAIDISDGFLKAVAVPADKSEKKLRVLASLPLPADEDKGMAKEIRAFISKYKLGGSLFSVNFPRHLVTIKSVKLPSANEQEMKNMAELQAIKYLPYSREEIVVDYKTADITKEGYVNILLILARRKSVDKYIEAFTSAGISINRMALSSEGILNWYLALGIDDKKPIAVIDVDRRHTHVQIMKNKNLVFSRSISFDITDARSDKNLFLKEIKMSFDSYLKEKAEEVSRVIVSGSERHSKEISTFLAGNFSFPCGNVEQLRRVKPGTAKIAGLPKQLAEASYTHLIGLASWPEKLEVNLMPKDVINKRKERAAKGSMVKTAILFLCVIMAAFGIMQKKMGGKRVYLRKIEFRLKEIEPEIKELSMLKENVKLIQEQLMFKGSAIDIIRQLYEILPIDVSLALFEFEDKNRVLLRGTSTELSTV